ncbi:hypothetical protein K474DRAFT_1666743 [Panus rudis PR-1116 ss-1]|nr:hypothetical protein K474DRAFT_1666743 [Panus rudis PR-1116 ss-1]
MADIGPYIPFELVTHITQYLRTDPPSLRASTLVCSAWHAASRPHIFYFITLSSIDQLRSLESLLETDPTVGYWIQHLRVVSSDITRDANWIPIFPQKISSKLHTLASITFVRVPFHRYIKSQTWCQSSGFSAFKTVTHLSFVGSCRPTPSQLSSLVCSLPELNYLNIDGVLMKPDVEASFPSQKAPCLSTLRVGTFMDPSAESFSKWLSSSNVSSGLRSVVLQIPDTGFSMDWNEISSCAESLAIYEPSQVVRGYKIFTKINVTSCINLRDLFLHDLNCQAGMLELLSRLPNPHTLAKLTLAMPSIRRRSKRSRDVYLALDEMLSSERFPKIGQVNLVAVALRGEDVVCDDIILRRLSNTFPGVAAKGILHIHIGTDSDSPAFPIDLTSQTIRSIHVNPRRLPTHRCLHVRHWNEATLGLVDDHLDFFGDFALLSFCP